VRRGLRPGRAPFGPSLSGPRVVACDRGVRHVLPALHPQAYSRQEDKMENPRPLGLGDRFQSSPIRSSRDVLISGGDL
jgi:hypothetical protein